MLVLYCGYCWRCVDLLAKERQNLIAALLKADGAVMVSDLVQRFDVSVETVRRDLEYLENQGYIS